jgi:hypothetical protein
MEQVLSVMWGPHSQVDVVLCLKILLRENKRLPRFSETKTTLSFHILRVELHLNGLPNNVVHTGKNYSLVYSTFYITEGSVLNGMKHYQNPISS